jgi:hypothetical protein
MNTLLNEILSRKELKNGYVISPAFCGNTYAMCNKAVLLAMEGEDVLVAANSLEAIRCSGGTISVFRKVLEVMGVDYRISEKSNIITVCAGKIKICDGDFVPDKYFDTMIVLDNVHYVDNILSGKSPVDCKNKIIHRTPMQLVKEGVRVKKIRSLSGRVVEVKGPMLLASHFTSEVTNGCDLVHNKSMFLLNVKQRDDVMVGINSSYARQLDSLPFEKRMEMNCTDLTEIYKYINNEK